MSRWHATAKTVAKVRGLDVNHQVSVFSSFNTPLYFILLTHYINLIILQTVRQEAQIGEMRDDVTHKRVVNVYRVKVA